MTHPLVSGAGALAVALLLTPPALARPGGAALDLPGAGPVSDVAQTPFRDGFAQRISFRDSPRAVAEVSVRNGGTGAGFGSALTMAKPSRTGIAAELRARFAGETMRVVTQARRNAYGPVGMAMGSDCLYAWQWIELGTGRDGRRARPASLFGEGGSAASVRIKLCRTAGATLADLAQAVERMRLSVAPGDAPFSREAPETRAGAGAERRETPRRRPPAASVAAKPPERAAPPPGAMDRPRMEPPPAAVARRAGPDPQRVLTPGPGGPRMPAPALSGQSQAPRYITDGTPGAGPSAIAVPKPAPNRAEVEELLSRELPARAYRPPP